MRIPRLLWAGLITALLGLPIIFALLQRVPNEHDVEILDAAAGWPSIFVTLGHTTSDDGVHTARKAIWLKGPHGLLEHDEVRLLMVGAPVTLLQGEIRASGSDCVYRTPPDARLLNGNYLTFRRAQPCAVTAAAEFELTIAFRGTGRVGLATYFVPPDRVDPTWLTLTTAGAADPRPVPVVRGRYVDDVAGAPLRRVELLANMWQVAESPRWIWAAVGMALLLVWASASFSSLATAPAPWWPAAVACSGIAFGVSLLYAVLVPPLQAPDEPDHLLAFAQLGNRPALTQELAEFAKHGHFERIRGRPEESFRKVDLDTPLAVAWDPNEVFAHDVTTRSVTTTVWWRLLAPPLQDLSAAGVTLALRLANALVFAISLGLAAALLLWTSRARGGAPHVICLALLLIPTLPFFAMHVSEFALMICAYIVLGAAVAALFLDGDRVHLLGVPIGVATSCILAGGRSGLPYLAMIATVAGGRALMGSLRSAEGTAARHALTFWGGLALGLALFPLLSTPAFRDGLWPADAPQVPPWFQSAAELFRRNPWFLGVAIPIGLLCEFAGTRLREKLAAPGLVARRLVIAGCMVIVAAIVASLVLSVFVPYPTLGGVDRTRPASAYASDVLEVTATSFRMANHDWPLSASFWGGFGWLETALPERAITIPIVLTALASIALLLWVARTAAFRQAAWLVVLASGWVITVITYAVSNYFLGRGLHGRYMIGLYLAFLMIAWSGAGLIPRKIRVDRPGFFRLNREGVILLVGAILHTIAIRTILLRYF